LVPDEALDIARFIYCPRWQAPALLGCIDPLLVKLKKVEELRYVRASEDILAARS
jgi:hypothetical protein